MVVSRSQISRAGAYQIHVSAEGFSPFTTGEFTLSTEQPPTVLHISMSVATVATEVTVRPTEVIAAEQIKAEEKQRLLGLFPNFYVSYVKGALPLSRQSRSSPSLRMTRWIGPRGSASVK